MHDIEPIKLIIDFDDEEDEDQSAGKEVKEATQDARESTRQTSPVPS